MEIVMGLLVAVLTMGLPLAIALVIRQSMKNEMSFFSHFDSDIAVFRNRSTIFEKLMVNLMRNDGVLDLEKIETEAEQKKFNDIPFYFNSSSVPSHIRYRE